MITELNLIQSQSEVEWVISILETTASAGVNLKEAIPDYRYGIKKLTINTGTEGKWIKIKNGSDNFIGPFTLKSHTPFTLIFESTVYCDIDNALVLVTEEDFAVSLCIRGVTGLPIPSKSYNPSPANEATGVSTDATLTWDSIYQSVNYKVYFGTSPSGMTMVSDQSELEYDPSLSANTTYYWRIDEYLGGDSAEGDIWTFTTGG